MYHNVSNLYYSVGQFGQFGINIFQSDKRLKKEIKNTKVKALDTIKKIKHRQFKWKRNDDFVEVGFIAQELRKLNSNFVLKVDQPKGNKYKFLYQIDDTKILPYITKGMQELCEEFETLQNRITILESEKKL